MLSSTHELLARWADDDGDRNAFTFIQDDGRALSIGYRELSRRVAAFASVLRDRSAPGDRALLLMSPGLEYIVTLLACFTAEVIAVPAYPPAGRPDHRSRERLYAIWRDAAPSLLIASDATVEFERTQQTPWREAGWLPVGHLLDASLEALGSGPDLDGIALLQYTSGSTSDPKGVVIRHRHLAHNAAMLVERGGHHSSDVSAMWLPPFHDMGLIGSIVQPLHCRIHSVLLSPAQFIQRPLRWLQTIAKYQATVSAAPNFAYELVAERLKKLEPGSLDLSSWTLAYMGAEPVRASTVRAFCDAAAPFGFDPDTLCPSFGLAEATLFVSGGPRRAGATVRAFDSDSLEHAGPVSPPAEAPVRELVGCGPPAPGLRLFIVDPVSGGVVEDGSIGEIWVSAGNVASGYWSSEGAATTSFGTSAPDGVGTDRFLRTGDLGFMDSGELFVLGRIKETIIVRGRTLYPTDIEATITRACGATSLAVFGVDDGLDENIVAVIATERGMSRDLVDVVAAVRAAVVDEIAVPLSGIRLVRRRHVPMTSSGKVRRGTCRERYLAGALPPVYDWSTPRLAALVRSGPPGISRGLGNLG